MNKYPVFNIILLNFCCRSSKILPQHYPECCVKFWDMNADVRSTEYLSGWILILDCQTNFKCQDSLKKISKYIMDNNLCHDYAYVIGDFLHHHKKVVNRVIFHSSYFRLVLEDCDYLGSSKLLDLLDHVNMCSGLLCSSLNVKIMGK